MPSILNQYRNSYYIQHKYLERWGGGGGHRIANVLVLFLITLFSECFEQPIFRSITSLV